MLTLNDIITEPTFEPPRIVIIGVGGIGKTTFGCSAPGAILARTEDGLGKIKCPRFPDIFTSWQEVVDMISMLVDPSSPFKHLCFDSLDWLEPIIWKATCEEHGKVNIEDFGYGKGYLYAEKYWRMFFKGLEALRKQKNMTVVLTAHTEIKRFNAPDSEPYDRYQIKLHQRAAELAHEWADIVFFANWESHVQKADVGFKKQVARGVGSGRRILYSEERPAFRAKNRYGLPARMDLTHPFPWPEFLHFISDGASSSVIQEAASEDDITPPETTTTEEGATPNA